MIWSASKLRGGKHLGDVQLCGRYGLSLRRQQRTPLVMVTFAELKRRNVFRVMIAYAIVAWLLIEVAATTFPILRLPDWSVTLVTVLLIIGFPVALFFAWAYELTPAGVKRDRGADHSDVVGHVAGRKLDFIIIFLLAVAVAYLGYDKFLGDVEAPAPGIESVAQDRSKTIAVLPFVNMSGSAENEYFSDGLTEEILTALAQLPELRVTGRTSSFFFKGKNIPIPEIAARLDVAHILEGSVRRDGDRVRITAQLVRASDDFHLWAQRYDRTLDDIFAVQQDIAETVAHMLDLVLDHDVRRMMRDAGIHDVEAFVAYQKGIEAFEAAHAEVAGLTERLKIANEYFDQALEISPRLVLARVMKADRAGHVVRDIASGARRETYPGEANDAVMTLREQYDLAWQLSQPGNQQDILDLERTLFSDDWRALKTRVKKALQPGRCPQMDWANEFVAPLGWSRQLVHKSRETLACDPLNLAANHELPFLLIWAGDFDAALGAVEAAEARGIRNPRLDDGRYWALLAKGQVDDPMVRGPAPQGSGMPFPRQILREALAGDPDTARRLAMEYWSSPDAVSWASIWLAAVVGDRDRANQLAALIDTRPGSAIVFSGVIFTCFCGAPFDLDAAPHFRTRIEEAAVPWPPAKPIDYPTKDW